MTPELEQRLQKIEGILAQLVKSDRYTIERTMQFLDGRNVQTGRNVGTIIATAADQKVALHGLTPVIQYTIDPTNAAGSLVVTNTFNTALFANGTYNELEANMINVMYQTLLGHGLFREEA